jgi:Tol biopolymer transport system component
MDARRTLIIVALVVLVVTPSVSAGAKPPGPNGRIAYNVFVTRTGSNLLYTANPDGTDAVRLTDRYIEFPHWSPDGTIVVGLGPGSNGEETSAVFVDVETGATRQFVMSDPTMFYACPHWSPNGARLACEGLDETHPERNGIYTIRSTDGGGLTRVTWNPRGDDIPGDYSPDGTRMVFTRLNPRETDAGLFVKTIGGGAAVRITPRGMIPDAEGMTWSPDGTTIVFAAQDGPERRFAVYLVAPDGSGLRRVPIPCGGPFSDPTSVDCRQPDWSPDGTMILVSRGTASGHSSDLYTVAPDGSELTRITRTPTTFDTVADWGTHP